MIYGLKDQAKKALEESVGTLLSRDSASDATALREIAEMERNSSGLDGWLAEAKQEARELAERENRLNAQVRGSAERVLSTKNFEKFQGYAERRG